MTETGPRVLVVDDEQAIRHFLRVSLTANAYLVYEAERGSAGCGDPGPRSAGHGRRRGHPTSPRVDSGPHHRPSSGLRRQLLAGNAPPAGEHQQAAAQDRTRCHAPTLYPDGAGGGVPPPRSAVASRSIGIPRAEISAHVRSNGASCTDSARPSGTASRPFDPHTLTPWNL
jgi:hypothetical protein